MFFPSTLPIGLAIAAMLMSLIVGVISGLVTGFLTTILWANIPELKAIVTERLSSFVFAFCVVYIISYYYPDETKRSN